MELEQNEIDDILNQDMDDSTLPPGAEHVAQPAGPQQLPPGDAPGITDDSYVTSYCQKINDMGMNARVQDFPQEGAEDYAYNLKDLPLCWGFHPMDFKPDKLDDILRGHNKACFIIHPDKHYAASGRAKSHPQQPHGRPRQCQGHRDGLPPEDAKGNGEGSPSARVSSSRRCHRSSSASSTLW